MTPTTVDPRALQVLERAFREKGWLDPRWPDSVQRFCATLTDRLGASLPSLPAAVAFATAYTEARAEVPMALPAFHETWARVAVCGPVRELVRAAGPGPARIGSLGAELTQVAQTLAAAAHGVARSEGGAVKLRELGRAVVSARKALLEARDATLVDHPARGFAAALFNQLSHALSGLVGRDAANEALVRDAVRRADAAARRNGVQAWVHASVAQRRGLVRACLAEAGFALAAAAAEVATGAGDERDAALWLARLAAQVQGAVGHVDAWYPGDGGETPAVAVAVADDEENDTHSADAAARRENVMKENTNTLVKTLQVDATDAAWRAAGSQLVKLARDPLVGLLARHLAPDDESVRARIAAFLETELGTAMLAAVLSAGLAAVPIATGDVPQRLSRELRVRAMADVGDLAAEVLVGPLREVIALYLRDLGPTVSAHAPAALEEPQSRLQGNVVAMNDREALSK